MRSGTPSDRRGLFLVKPSARQLQGSIVIGLSPAAILLPSVPIAAGRMIRRTADPAFCGRNHLGVDLSGTVHSPGDHLCGDQQEQPKQADDR